MIVHCLVEKRSYFMPDSKPNFTTHIHTCSLTRQLEYDKDVEYNLFNVTEARRVLPNNIKIHIKDPLTVSLLTRRAANNSGFCIWQTGDQLQIHSRKRS